MITPVLFTLHGLLGALIAVLIKAYSWRFLKTWKAVRWLILGALSGYVYYWLYSEYSFPDGIMAIVAGYFGADFIQSLFEKLRKLLETRNAGNNT